MEKIKHLFAFSWIAIAWFGTSCNLDNDDETRTIIGEGPVVTQVVAADTFSTFLHLGIGHVNITTGDSLEVYVKAQQNIIDEMEFAFGEGIFAWGFTEQLNIQTEDTILLVIKMPNDIKWVQVAGTGIVNIQGPKQESIILETIGYTQFYCYDLEVDRCDLNIMGIAQCRVRVNEEITGEITGTGYVYYKGDPEVNVRLIGSGEIIDDN